MLTKLNLTFWTTLILFMINLQKPLNSMNKNVTAKKSKIMEWQQGCAFEQKKRKRIFILIYKKQWLLPSK